MSATVASRRCSGVIPGSGAPTGCGTDEPGLAPGDGRSPSPPATDPPLLASSAGEAPLSAPPVAPREAVVPELPELEPLAGLELEVSELEPPDDPSPQPVRASARKTPALAIPADLLMKRSAIVPCAFRMLRPGSSRSIRQRRRALSVQSPSL